MDGGVPPDGGQLLVQGLRAVRHGVQVGHGADSGVAPRGGGGGAGGHGFLIRKTRLPKMDVYINEAWDYETMIQFKDGAALSGKGGGNGNNTALGNGDIQRLEAPVAKNGPAGQQKTHSCTPFQCLRHSNKLSYQMGGVLSTGVLRGGVSDPKLLL